MMSVSRPSLSQPSFSATSPSSRSLASSTTAAQPSPNSTETPRLSQSMSVEMSSPPTTTALRTTPVRISALAVLSA
jgi:hypothetical protein